MGNPAPHRARKRFGQHFLHDHNIIQRIIRALHPKPHDNLVEIGPGEGALTYPLLSVSGRLTAIELDRDLIPRLQKGASGKGELTLVNQDVLTVDLQDLGLAKPLRLVGNLPYNISTPLMFHLLAQSEWVSDMHFMVQKEVALRIIARANDPAGNSKHYGRLSVMMQYYCDSEYLFDVPPSSFSPPPKVDSAVIRLTPRPPEVEVDDLAVLESVVLAAFSQRRKTIANSLKKQLDSATISALDIDPTSRAENLTLQDFARITQAISPT
jgi:16S rRNA (adenine1518-N6/adenine1519-N6)-dimethyltransferase